MPRSTRPQICACGCGEETKGGRWVPSHDALTLSDIINAVGGTEVLLALVERNLGHPVPRVKRPEVKR